VPETVRQAIKADPQIGPLVQAARQRLVPDTTPQAAMADQTFLARNLFCLRLKEHLPLSPALSFKLLYGLSWLYYVPRTALSNGG
jgi:hypothetical protein